MHDIMVGFFTSQVIKNYNNYQEKWIKAKIKLKIEKYKMLAGNSGTKTPMIMIKLKIATADFWMH
jgi:hypothetical protein